MHRTQTRHVTVEAHRESVRQLLAPLRSPDRIEVLPLLAALGRGLAADVVAPLDLPPFANSQMDGFAIRSADVPDGGTELRVVAPVPAGAAPPELAPGTAAPIMTGAMLPPGADAVVPVEQAVPAVFPAPGVPATVRLPAVPARNFIRDAGSDIRAGELALPAGTYLGPGQLGLLAALGLTEVPVYRALRILLVTTGDEVVEPGSPLGPGKIYDSNATLLESSMRQAGLDVTRTGISTDRPEELAGLLRRHAADVDLIVTTGGVSKGAYEVVRQAMEGHNVDFFGVAMQPGGPQGIGTFDGVP
ncbi:MAG TPA: molybdopterin molybdotransferase MoeA, partial [Arthrobacter sp.]|nr:molybdopterin molybdotransferase MoeA [Arthrobacter sp.]